MIGQETRDEEGICSPHVRSVGLDNIKVKWFSRCLDSFSQPYSSAYPCNLTAEYLMNRYMLPNTLAAGDDISLLSHNDKYGGTLRVSNI